MLLLREYEMGRDPEITKGMKGLYVYDNSDYRELNMVGIFQDLDNAESMMGIYENKGGYVIPVMVRKDGTIGDGGPGNHVMVHDGGMEIRTDDVIVCGYNRSTSKEEFYYEWIMIVGTIYDDETERYGHMEYPVSLRLAADEIQVRNEPDEFDMDDSSTAQEWIRKATEKEIEEFVRRVNLDGREEIVTPIRKWMERRKGVPLKPLDKVLVRDSDDGSWEPAFFIRFTPGKKYPYLVRTITDEWYRRCIPLEGNERLAFTEEKPADDEEKKD